MITRESSYFGVHATHCCPMHGCKYMEDDICPVVNGLDKGVECEACEWDQEQIVDAIELLIANGWIPEGYDPALHELLNVPKGV